MKNIFTYRYFIISLLILFQIFANNLLAEQDSSVVLGCVNPLAENYNRLATKDDGSCIFENSNTVINTQNYLDNDIQGCIDPIAKNYNRFATKDDGSCQYDSLINSNNNDMNGCTNSEACNYDDNAIIDDGSCLFFDECGVCGGGSDSCLDCLGIPNGNAMLDKCGICDDNTSNDCTQDCAGNWGGDAILDDCGECNGSNLSCLDCNGVPNGPSKVDQCGTCDDNIENDCIKDCEGILGGSAILDNCGICNPDIENINCTGCMDPLASNYNNDCYFYDNNEKINLCLFNDLTQCNYDFTACCTDKKAVNYDNDCELNNMETCIYGFNIDVNRFNKNDFNKLYKPYALFETINFLNIFYYSNKNYSDFFVENIDRIPFNNQHLFSRNYIVNPENFPQKNDYEFKLSENRNFFILNKKNIVSDKNKYFFDNNGIMLNNINMPALISVNDYFYMSLYTNRLISFYKKMITSFYDKYNEQEITKKGAIVLYESDFFSIDLQGTISINGDLEFQDKEETQFTDGGDDFNFNIRQKQRFKLNAYIGDRLTISANQDSEADFDWQNTLLIQYKGYENEIVQEASIGNISLSLPHTQLVSVGMGKRSGLFGVKLHNKFGPLDIYTILGREKVTKGSKSTSSGSATEGNNVYDYNFIKDKYFFIDLIFKHRFYPLRDNNSGTFINDVNYNIADFTLFKKITSQSTQSYDGAIYKGVAYYDSELSDIEQLNSSENAFYADKWLELIEGQDYEIDKQLGFIKLNTPTANDMLAVYYTTYQEFNGIPGYQPGEQPGETVDANANFTNTIIDEVDICLKEGEEECDYNSIAGVDYEEINGIAGYQDGIVLKLIKEEGTSTSLKKTWPLMLKNVYSLGATGIDPNSLQIDVVYYKGALGTETASPNGNTYLNIFGLDNRDINGNFIEGGDGQVDIFNSSLFRSDWGVIILPFHMPFSYDTNPYIEDETINFSEGSETFNRYWGNPHPDLENVFQKDLENIEYQETQFYQNYADGPSMYFDYTPTNNSDIANESKFLFKINHSEQTATMNLGFGIVENSETVLLNGSIVLMKGTDYVLEYFTGTLTLISPRATDPTAEITVSYDQNDIVSFDQKVIAGSYLIYDINNYIDLFGGIYYYSQTLPEEKVDVGQEPMENFMWHIGANYSRDFHGLTQRINNNTHFDFINDIGFSFSAEYAEVYPNPNPLGVAYIDDFEDSRITSYIPLNYNSWQFSSPPVHIDQLSNNNRIDMFYYNPYVEVLTQDIWPEITVTSTANNATTKTLWLELDKNGEYVEDGRIWNSIVFPLNIMDQDQRRNNYIDIWMNIDDVEDDSLIVSIDLGSVNEDINQNNKFDTEDVPPEGQLFSNDILDDNEDIGVDGCMDNYEDGWGRCLSNNEGDPTYEDYLSSYEDEDFNNCYTIVDQLECIDACTWLDSQCIPKVNFKSFEGDPNRDNYYAKPENSEYYNYDNNGEFKGSINGTEGNGQIFRYPDSEDLNTDESLNTTDSYFNKEFKPSEEINQFLINNTSLVESESGENWYLFRIPLTTFEEQGDPDWSYIQNLRLSLIRDRNGASNNENTIKIAKIEMVGNKWEPLGIVNNENIGNLSYDGVYENSNYLDTLIIEENITVEVVNTEDNPDYMPPPGVSAEYNEYEGRYAREQSLSINFTERLNSIDYNGIDSQKSFFIDKNTGYSTFDSNKRESFFAYKYFQMFVNGISTDGQIWDEDSGIEFSIRIGRENNYYEIRQPFTNSISETWENVKIDLEEISRYKYDNINEEIYEEDYYEDTGEDGCIDERESGFLINEGELDPDNLSCMPEGSIYDPNQYENYSNDDICEYVICPTLITESDCNVEDACSWNDYLGYCAAYEFDPLINYFRPIYDEAIEPCVDFEDQYYCEGSRPTGCYWSDNSCLPIINVEEICTADGDVVDDPNQDNFDSILNPDGAEENLSYDIGEPVYNSLGELQPDDYIFIESGEYDYVNDLWYWDDESISSACFNCSELRVKGEPSISRIDYIIFGVINNSNSSIYGKVYLNEIRLSGVKEEKGSAYLIDGSFDFGDLFTVSAGYLESDANFHKLEERIGNSDHRKDSDFAFSFKTDELFKKQFFTNSISMSYSNTISAPKYKPGSDIYLGSIENTPDSLRTYSNRVTVSTNMTTILNNLHRNYFFKEVVDRMKFKYTYTNQTKSTPTIKNESSYKHDYTFSYNKPFEEKKIHPFKFLFSAEKWDDSTSPIVQGVKKFYISLLPSDISFSSSLNDFKEVETKRPSYGGTKTFTEYIKHSRAFKLNNYQVLSDFKIGYQNTVESNLDPNIKENEIKLKSKALMDIFNVPGVVTKYADKSNFSYKPEYLNLQTWLKPNFTYSAEYFWQRNLSTNSGSANIGSSGTTSADFTIKPSKFLERFYTSGSNNNEEKFFESKNIYIKNLLKLLHGMSKKLSSININLKYKTKSSFGNVKTDFNPSLRFRLGLDENPIQLNNLNSLQAENMILSYAYGTTKEFQISSSLQISPKVSFSNLKYKYSFDLTEKTGYEDIVSISENYFSQGLNGRKGLPLFNWSINVTNLQDLWILKRWFKNVMISHQFDGMKQRRYDGDILKNIEFSKNFTPIIGLTFKLRSPDGMQISVNKNKNLTISNTLTSDYYQVRRNVSEQLGITIKWTKRKNKEMKFFSRRIDIENEVSFKLDISIDKSFTEESTNPAYPDLFARGQFSNSLSLKPGVTYSFNDWVNGTFYLLYSEKETHTSNKVKKVKIGFDVTIFFESRNKN